MRVAATFKLRKRRLIHKTQAAKACGYQLQKEKITFDITILERESKNCAFLGNLNCYKISKKDKI